MKLFISVFILYSANVSSQSFSGHVIDLETTESLAFANVMLYKNDTLAYHSNTNIDGLFEFENIKSGDYRLEVSYVGYELLTDQITQSPDHTNDIPLMMLKNQHMLTSIELIGYRGSNPKCCGYGRCCETHCYGQTDDTLSTDSRLKEFEKRKKFSNITVYPNPTIEYFIIKNNQEYDYLEVYSSDQKSILSKALSRETERINTNQWFSGIYMILMFKENRLIKTEKLVVCKS